MFEEVTDLIEHVGRNVVGGLPLGVAQANLAHRNGQNLPVDTAFVFHHEHGNGTATANGTGHQREGRQNTHVNRVTVVGDRLRNVAIVAGIVHRRADEAVNKQGTRLFVHFILDRSGIGRNFNNHIKVARQIAAGGHSGKTHFSTSLFGIAKNSPLT